MVPLESRKYSKPRINPDRIAASSALVTTSVDGTYELDEPINMKVPATLYTIQANRDKYKGNVIAVFTSGGDAQGMNSAIRAIARMGIFVGCKVYFIHEGYEGMVDGGPGMFTEAQWGHVSGIIGVGGTLIGSARCKSFRERPGRLKAAKNLIDRSISNLVCIGGDGSLTGANKFREEWHSLVEELLSTGRITQTQADQNEDLSIVGLVGSIDNDFCGTDMTIGADSALHRIMEAIDAISTTGSSHMRCFVLEVMGRRCGYLALMTAIGSDADWLFIPECPAPENWQDAMCKKLKTTRGIGQRLNIIIVAEGAVDIHRNPVTSEQVKQVVTERLGYDTRVTVLGHVQRGGSISAFDRILGTRMGAEAVIALMENKPDSPPVVISLAGNQAVRVPLTTCVQKTINAGKAMDNGDFQSAVALRGKSFKTNLEMYIQLGKLRPTMYEVPETVYRVALMNIGAPAGGMNACVRSLVREILCTGHKPVMVYDGWEGLIEKRVKQADWMSVSGWTGTGGCKLGTQKNDTSNFKLVEIAEALRHFNINALIIVGGFEGFLSVMQLCNARAQHPEFKIPMILIPATISNNIPGTDFTLGADTALNEIIAMVDKMKQSAQGSKRRVFIVETMGGYCGYLATLAGLASGADQAYIHEEHFTVAEILEDAEHLLRKMQSDVKRGIVLRNEHANSNFNIDFLQRLFSEHGKGTYSTRSNVLGHQQQGGSPSPFDRSFGTRLGSKAVAQCVEWMQQNKNDDGVSTDDPETAAVLGLMTRSMGFTSVTSLQNQTDFKHRVPINQWWMKLRPLLRILAKHQSIYVTEMAG